MIVLASASPARRRMLAAAGVDVLVDPAEVDEPSLRRALPPNAAAADAALVLARAKAVAVAARQPGALVIGADQMLEHGGRWLDKPSSRAAAREQLLALRGGTHHLVSAVAVARDGTVLWQHVAAASLTMRVFSEAFLDAYLDRAGAGIWHSVGAYHLEGLGVQLFSTIDGDFFTVLGMPLLPLLETLRAEGALAS